MIFKKKFQFSNIWMKFDITRQCGGKGDEKGFQDAQYDF